MHVSALEHCKKLMGEKSYLIELLEDGWKPSIKKECQQSACAGRPVAATDDLNVQAVRVLLEEDRRWTCVEISMEFGIAALTVHTILM